MPRLGQMLVDARVIGKAQLEDAIQSQVIFGGRLGTNLIELGLLDEQTLTQYLSKQHQTPTVNWTQINRIKPQVLKLFTKKLAKQCEAFPLKIEGKDIYVVMTDPKNFSALDAIKFASGKNVIPLVLPEIRVFDLLTRFYNVGRELRYLNLAMQYKIKSSAPEAAAKKPAKPVGVSEQEWKEREAIRTRIDFTQSGELLGEDDFHKMADAQIFTSLSAAPRAEPSPAAFVPPPPAAIAAAPAPPSPPRPAAPPVTRAPAPTPAPAATRPAPPVAPAAPPAPGRPAPQPYREVAQALYSLMIRKGVENYIPRATLQEFLKLFVKSQLRAHIVNLNYLANWMIIESNAPIEWLEAVLAEFKQGASALGVTVLLPGETLPEAKPKPAPPPPPAPPAPAAVEEEEILEAVEEAEEIKETAASAAPAAVAASPPTAPRLAPPAPSKPAVPQVAPPLPAPTPSPAPPSKAPAPPPPTVPAPPTAPAPSPAARPPAPIATPAAPAAPAPAPAPPAQTPPPPAPTAAPLAPPPAVMAASPPPAAPAEVETPASPSLPEIEVVELSAEDMASAEELGEYVPEEEAEEEVAEEIEELTLEQARQKLLTEVNDRRDISRIILGFSRGAFKRSALFTVRGQTLYGWDGQGPKISSDQVETIMLPLTEPSAFQLVNATTSFFMGPMQPGPINDRYLKLLGGEKPNNVLIIPVVWNEKVVYMFYGDNGQGQFVPLNWHEIQLLAYLIPQALAKLIERKKAQKPAG